MDDLQEDFVVTINLNENKFLNISKKNNNVKVCAKKNMRIISISYYFQIKDFFY